MKCQICGCSVLPGAKHCADCRAARKRAFAATVTQPLIMAASSKSARRLLRPGPSAAQNARRAAEQALFVQPEADQQPIRRRGVFYAACAMVSIGIVVAVYQGRQLDANRSTDALSQATQPASTDRQPSSTGMSVAPTLTALKPSPTAESIPAPATEPAPSPAAKDTAKRASTKQRVAMALPAPAPLLEPLAAAATSVPALEAPVAPAPDRWQSMSDSLAQCAGGLMDRFVCDTRVRQEYCSGYWGKVPQCPSGVAGDNRR